MVYSFFNSPCITLPRIGNIFSILAYPQIAFPSKAFSSFAISSSESWCGKQPPHYPFVLAKFDAFRPYRLIALNNSSTFM